MKHFKIAFLLTVLMSIISLNSSAHDFEVDGIYYVYNDGANGSTVSVSFKGNSYDDYTEYFKIVSIPDVVNYSGKNYRVTCIGNGAFFDCRGLTAVNIPSSIINIGSRAFYNCSGLTSVVIPPSVLSISDEAFCGCSFTSVFFPSSIKSIGDNAFRSCPDLSAIVFSCGLESIGNSAFSGCSLSSVSIPSSVTMIGVSAFSNNYIESIVVEEGNSKYDSRGNCNAIIETNSNTLISGCSNTLIPNTVTAIGEYSFYGCYNLSVIDIPNSVTNISDYAFSGCSFNTVLIPSSVMSIGSGAFKGCSALSSLYISEGVKSIGGEAFASCKKLASVNIPSSVISIGGNAFAETEWYNSQPNGLVYAGKVAYKYKGTIYSVFSNGSRIVLEEGTLGIAGLAFISCKNLVSVNIPSTVRNIGDMAFYLCDDLISVTINTNAPVSITPNVFWNYDDATLYVPYGSKATYEPADYWKEFKEIVEMEPAGIEVTDISQMDNAIYIEPFTARVGDAVEIEVSLKNAETASAYNFELVLPEGISINVTEENDFDEAVTLSSRNSKHQVTTNKVGDNTYRLAVASLSSKTLTGNDGVVLTIAAHVSEEMQESTYPVQINSPLLVGAAGSKPAIAATQTTVTVENYLKGDVDGDGTVDLADAVVIINYCVGKTVNKFVEKAADADGDGVIDLADAVRIINYCVGKITELSRRTFEVELDPQ